MEQTITTRGIGTAFGAPDAIRLSIGLVGRAPNVSNALAAAAQGVAAAGAVAREFTEPDRITSTGLNVWPWHDNEGRQRGYEARHSLQIYCVGLDSAGDLVTALADKLEGALSVDTIEPIITDPAPLASEARRRAVADSRAKATELAGLSDLALGTVLSIAEGGGSEMPMETRAFKASASDATRFESGSASVSTSVTVVWSAHQSGG